MAKEKISVDASDVGSRLFHLDSIRGVAALLVLIAHFVMVPSITVAEPSFASLVQHIDFARIGVVLFFLVSGFVIPYSLKRGHTIWAFGIKRVFRLYPAYWVSLISAILMGIFFTNQNYPLQQIIANTTMLQNFLHSQNILGVYWTLKLELGFYILAALIFCIDHLDNTKFIAFLSALLFVVFIVYLDYWTGFSHFGERIFSELHLLKDNASGGAGNAANHPIPGLLNMNWGNFCGYFSAMFLGTALRLLAEGRANRFDRAIIIGIGFLWAGLLSIIGLVAYSRTHDLGLFSMCGSWVVSLLLFIILTFYIKLKMRAFVWLGVVSYSVYLFHPLVIDGMFATQFISKLLLHSPIFGLLICIGITAVAAQISFSLIEQPVIALGHSIARKAGRNGFKISGA
ncbi:acyltransferase family protein [Robbsia andropogonis]|uniref:acyltransferase family protein n=1 Tax=Robbsia andropogonis TaxID=28092 RepID=UPI003D1C7301